MTFCKEAQLSTILYTECMLTSTNQNRKLNKASTTLEYTSVSKAIRTIQYLTPSPQDQDQDQPETINII
ncbi:uncharacterized protein N7446_006755 [Penicillium canescens]|uniref:Uncharacterized protein n=1 Tax=Penicillium canescens TaxID=5083 RepID=A0AAD6IK92_PENCN|nr:uncharacterized protein N7446_006755 [Penicillium canescens]KAJ6049918.1 hypothetical protein N7444_006634 [Penicillium canescens]KAJ6052113.1 hypothetical protein N7460_002647 [Penicillium canescens]KAJ6062635.1 hypothetical protein N7446_006755 [Penicillium canescens]